MIYPQPVADKAVKLYARLTKIREVADRMDVSYHFVRTVLHEARKPIRRVGRPNVPDNDPVLRKYRSR